jgi:hypothetical protein
LQAARFFGAQEFRGWWVDIAAIEHGQAKKNSDEREFMHGCTNNLV